MFAINDGISPFLILTIALICCLSTAASAAAAQFDGVWDVTIRTIAGSWEPTAHYAVTVTEGKVFGPENVSGTVGRSGNVRVSIGAAYANGQLDGNTGSGKWNGASGAVPCSGRWQASKQ
jgi:hypothetical protein